MVRKSSSETQPLDSTRRAFDQWIRADRALIRARAIARSTAEMKFRKANIRLAKQRSMRVAPPALTHTEDWQVLATRHFAAALLDDPEAWRDMTLAEAVAVLARHGYAPDET